MLSCFKCFLDGIFTNFDFLFRRTSSHTCLHLKQSSHRRWYNFFSIFALGIVQNLKLFGLHRFSRHFAGDTWTGRLTFTKSSGLGLYRGYFSWGTRWFHRRSRNLKGTYRNRSFSGQKRVIWLGNTWKSTPNRGNDKLPHIRLNQLFDVSIEQCTRHLFKS